MEEINSRGDEEEHVMAIANYLNMEEHLTDSMKAEPKRANEIAKVLDDVRETRQKLVKQWSKGKNNPTYWCCTKHAINSCYHLHELITNAARDSPDKILELTDLYKRCSDERDELIRLFLSGSSDGDCPRCEADLELISKKAEEGNSGSGSNIWLILGASFLVVVLVASKRSY